MMRLVLPLAVAGVLVGCGSDPTDFERSCAGETLLAPRCEPYELATVTAASIEPDAVPLGDPDAMARFHVELSTCPMAPRPVSVSVRMFTEASVIPIIDLIDDGVSDGDPLAMDGIIDASPSNPFTVLFPANADVVVRFEPRSGDCIGEELDVDYRTGSLP